MLSSTGRLNWLHNVQCTLGWAPFEREKVYLIELLNVQVHNWIKNRPLSKFYWSTNVLNHKLEAVAGVFQSICGVIRLHCHVGLCVKKDCRWSEDHIMYGVACGLERERIESRVEENAVHVKLERQAAGSWGHHIRPELYSTHLIFVAGDCRILQQWCKDDLYLVVKIHWWGEDDICLWNRCLKSYSTVCCQIRWMWSNNLLKKRYRSSNCGLGPINFGWSWVQLDEKPWESCILILSASRDVKDRVALKSCLIHSEFYHMIIPSDGFFFDHRRVRLQIINCPNKLGKLATWKASLPSLVSHNHWLTAIDVVS